MVYFVEKNVFGAPVPILPDGDIRIIHNETDFSDEINGIKDVIERYFKKDTIIEVILNAN